MGIQLKLIRSRRQMRTCLSTRGGKYTLREIEIHVFRNFATNNLHCLKRLPFGRSPKDAKPIEAAEVKPAEQQSSEAGKPIEAAATEVKPAEQQSSEAGCCK